MLVLERILTKLNKIFKKIFFKLNLKNLTQYKLILYCMDIVHDYTYHNLTMS